MTSKPVRNVAASVRQRLLNYARERNEDFGLVLTNYAIERLLVRLGESPYVEQFILKGAQVFSLWMDNPHRATRDLDLLRQGENSVALLETIFHELCLYPLSVDDGITFLAETVKGEIINEDAVYDGVRITLRFQLSGAQDVLQIDIGVGDVVTPLPTYIEMPSMLGFPSARLHIYPKETVVAEKLEAMIALGIRNSRMKDFYDLWQLSRMFSFDGQVLCRAIGSTFQRRHTIIPAKPPIALSQDFWQDEVKQIQWQAFLRRLRVVGNPLPLKQIITDLRPFLLPLLQALSRGDEYHMIWIASGGWEPLARSSDP
ncbi:MAG: nucleotidyl transferase AbiEii/AbiGii toxin family protein [bacterium]|nr:nucleotidyl transferase AbiEii/AbiGii toxin family protein [bacterium]